MAKRESPAMKLLRHVWAKGMKDSWGRINQSMHTALLLAIGSGLEFAPGDIKLLFARPSVGGFSGSYWVTADTQEWIYASAIQNGNRSAWQAWEHDKGREPFIANDVDGPTWGHTFTHTNSFHSQRCRLAYGFSFPIDGKRWRVTGFDDKAGIVRVALYKNNSFSGRPIRLRKLTHEQMIELCPAPKRKKATKGESDDGE